MLPSAAWSDVKTFTFKWCTDWWLKAYGLLNGSWWGFHFMSCSKKLAEERFPPVLGHKLDQGDVFIRMIDIPPWPLKRQVRRKATPKTEPNSNYSQSISSSWPRIRLLLLSWTEERMLLKHLFSWLEKWCISVLLKDHLSYFVRNTFFVCKSDRFPVLE